MTDEHLEAIGVIFNGMQECPNAPAIPLYTDLVTKSTFSLGEGESLTEAVDRKRREFHATPSDIGDMEADRLRYEERFGIRVSPNVEDMNRIAEAELGPRYRGQLR